MLKSAPNAASCAGFIAASSRALLVEAKPRRHPAGGGSRASPWHRERVPPQVVAIKLDEIERVEEHAPIVPAIADAIEARDGHFFSATSVATDFE